MDLTSYSQSKQLRSCHGRSHGGQRTASLDHLCRRDLPPPGPWDCPPVHSRAWPGPGRQGRAWVSTDRLQWGLEILRLKVKTRPQWYYIKESTLQVMVIFDHYRSSYSTIPSLMQLQFSVLYWLVPVCKIFSQKKKNNQLVNQQKIRQQQFWWFINCSS